MKKVTKAVIPAAGFCTRFLPAAKSIHKSMFPIGEKPALQLIVEDLVLAGIKDIIIVTGHHGESIENHFTPGPRNLIEALEKAGEKRKAVLEEVEKVSSLANFYFAKQKSRIGNFSPLYDVKNLLSGEPFIHTWADDMFYVSEGPNEYSQMINAYEKYDASVLPCTLVQDERGFNAYGIVSGDTNDVGDMIVHGMIEKPGKDSAPSNLGAVSSQLYKPEVFDYCEEVLHSLPEGKEFGYYDVVCNMIAKGAKVVGIPVKNSTYLDMGDGLAYLKAQILLGSREDSYGNNLKEFLKEFVKSI